MFERCFHDGQYKQALGIALETRRLDILQKAILQGDTKDLLAYCFQQAQKVVVSRSFRQDVLRKLVEIYRGLEVPDYISMCQCLLFLDHPETVAQALDSLLKKDSVRCQPPFSGSSPPSLLACMLLTRHSPCLQAASLMAYQVAFDLTENQNQPFLNRVVAALPVVEPSNPSAAPAATGAAPAAGASAGAASAGTSERTPLLSGSGSDSSSSGGSDSKSTAGAASDDSYASRLHKLKQVLSGDLPTLLYLQYLFTNNKTDLNILKLIKVRAPINPLGSQNC